MAFLWQVTGGSQSVHKQAVFLTQSPECGVTSTHTTLTPSCLAAFPSPFSFIVLPLIPVPFSEPESIMNYFTFLHPCFSVFQIDLISLPSSLRQIGSSFLVSFIRNRRMLRFHAHNHSPKLFLPISQVCIRRLKGWTCFA